MFFSPLVEGLKSSPYRSLPIVRIDEGGTGSEALPASALASLIQHRWRAVFDDLL